MTVRRAGVKRQTVEKTAAIHGKIGIFRPHEASCKGAIGENSPKRGRHQLLGMVVVLIRMYILPPHTNHFWGAYCGTTFHKQLCMCGCNA